MKKIMLSLAMALVSVCASAQVYIGGTAGISSNKIGDGDSKTAYTLMPEIGYQFNNKWEAGLEIGIKKGEVCKLCFNALNFKRRNEYFFAHFVLLLEALQLFNSEGSPLYCRYSEKEESFFRLFSERISILPKFAQ